MNTWISLLRGINVGGAKRLKMADLRALYADLGFASVQTVLQSGNAAFQSDLSEPAQIIDIIEMGIQDRFGFESKIILRDPAAHDALITANPYLETPEFDPKKVLVFYLREPHTDADIQRLIAAHTGPERITPVPGHLYLYYPDGMGRSRLDVKFLERHLDNIGTARNWNTTLKLRDLAAAADQS